MLNTRDTVVAEKKRCPYLAAAGVLHLEEVEQRQQAEQEGHEKEEETTQHRTRKARTVWVREWLARRHEFGNYDQLFTELHKKDPRGYRNYLMPNTHRRRRRDETVLSRRRRRCEHEFATLATVSSCRQCEHTRRQS